MRDSCANQRKAQALRRQSDPFKTADKTVARRERKAVTEQHPLKAQYAQIVKHCIKTPKIFLRLTIPP